MILEYHGPLGARLRDFLLVQNHAAIGGLQ